MSPGLSLGCTRIRSIGVHILLARFRVAWIAGLLEGPGRDLRCCVRCCDWDRLRGAWSLTIVVAWPAGPVEVSRVRAARWPPRAAEPRPASVSRPSAAARANHGRSIKYCILHDASQRPSHTLIQHILYVAHCTLTHRSSAYDTLVSSQCLN